MLVEAFNMSEVEKIMQNYIDKLSNGRFKHSTIVRRYVMTNIVPMWAAGLTIHNTCGCGFEFDDLNIVLGSIKSKTPKEVYKAFFDIQNRLATCSFKIKDIFGPLDYYKSDEMARYHLDNLSDFEEAMISRKKDFFDRCKINGYTFTKYENGVRPFSLSIQFDSDEKNIFVEEYCKTKRFPFIKKGKDELVITFFSDYH